MKHAKNHGRTGIRAALFAGSAIVFGALVAANPFSAAAETSREDSRGGSSGTSTSGTHHPRATSTTGEPKPTTTKAGPTQPSRETITSNPGPISLGADGNTVTSNETDIGGGQSQNATGTDSQNTGLITSSQE